MTEEHFNALPIGHKLFEYTIKSVLGHGGFGITYLAYDENLDKDVAIKEYLPAEFAVRQGPDSVRPRSSADGGDYEWGLERFMKEAQTLALFRHNSIVPVYRFFKANGTAYMVMEYQDGKSLAALMREHRGEFTEEDLVNLVNPILDGLAEVHKAGYLHRDVKPGNIFIRQNGTPVLLDFGAARQAVGSKSKNLTSIVTPGYAPLEQYFADGNQGPWTDIYALAAILYQCICGKIPPEAPARVKKDPIQPAQQVGADKYTGHFLAAIDSALAVEEELRPQSTEDWRKMLSGDMPVPQAQDQTAGESETMLAGGATILAGGGLSGAGVAAEAPPTGRREPSFAPPPEAPVGADGVGGRKGNTGKIVAIAAAAVFLVGLSAAGAYFVISQGETPGGEAKKGGGGTGAGNGSGNGSGNGGTDGPDKARAEEERKKREEVERKRLEEERKRADAERKRTEEETKRKAEEERKQREEAERRRVEEEAKRKAEEERKRNDAEARRKEEAERRRAEAERKKAEEERKKREEASLPNGENCAYSARGLQGRYNEVDCFFLRRTVVAALTTATAGSTSRWRNRRSGNSGTITILSTYTNNQNNRCRRFEQTLTTKGRTYRSRGAACFVGNGWRIVG